ncbi:hypothetical protein BC829DRAFT_385730 [Chytridium lagenaria]|nr:hypothetical protein BC829DRAFT_385730 [Chytridium lagenaria]
MKNNDQWMLCIARSILKDYDGALRSLVSKAEGGKTGVLDPTLYFLYNSLKKSFKVRRLKVKEIEPDVESEFVSEPVTTKETASNEIDWSAPISKAPNEIDWGAPVSKQSEDIDWGAPVSKLSEPQDFDWGAPVSKPVTGEQKTDDFDWGAPLLKKSLMGDSSGTDALDAEIGLDDITGSDERETESPSDTLSVLISKDNIKIYEWSLALKVAGLALSSIEDVSVQERLFKNDPMLNEFSLSVKTGLDSLEKAVAFPANAIRSILRRYPLPALLLSLFFSSNIVSYMHLNALYSYDTYLEDFSDILLRMTNHLCLITFDPPSLPPNYRNISRLSRQLLNSVPAVLWPSLAQATAAAVIALSCSAVKLYDYKTLWWIAGLSDKLFTLLAGGGKKTELWPLLSDILNTKNPLAHPESGTKKRKLAELILDSILLQHLHWILSGAFTSQGNLAERALLGVSKLIHSLQSEMIPVAQDLHPSSSLVHRNLTTQDQKLLWSLLRRTTNLGKMIDFATGLIPKDVPIVEGPPSPVKEDLDVLEIEGSPKRKTVKKLAARAADYQIVYNADNIIAGFAINPLDPDSIAIATHDSVIEIDVASSLSFYKRESFAERRESVDDLMVKQPSLDFHREGRSDPPKKIPRNLSYDSLERALKRSMISLRKQGVTSIEAHPSLNYCTLAGHLETSGEATVKLFQFGQQRELVSYLTGGSARITRCRFDPFGIRFGATTAKGELHIWRFDSSEQALRPAIDLTCNSTTTNDFTFLNCSTLLATAGVSASGNNIALWDTLLSPLAIDVRNDCLISGSAAGDVKIWDLTQFEETEAYDKMHMGPTTKGYNEIFSGMTSYGVMQINTHGGYTYTCGADGSLRKSTLSR